MSEKRVYQDKMLNSEKEIVICNWERGDGKTYSILNKIMSNGGGKYLYISPFNNSLGLQHCVKEANYYVKSCNISRDKITITDIEDEVIEIFCINPNTQFRGQRNIKMAFCDECYIDKTYIDTILKPMDVKQVYMMFTDDNMEYIDSRNSSKVENFYDKQIEELMIEYSNIVKNEKTTLTRENILKQIKVLQDMKKDN